MVRARRVRGSEDGGAAGGSPDRGHAGRFAAPQVGRPLPRLRLRRRRDARRRRPVRTARGHAHALRGRRRHPAGGPRVPHPDRPHPGRGRRPRQVRDHRRPGRRAAARRPRRNAIPRRAGRREVRVRPDPRPFGRRAAVHRRPEARRLRAGGPRRSARGLRSDLRDLRAPRHVREAALREFRRLALRAFPLPAQGLRALP